MARIPRQRNARSIRIWPGMDKDDTSDTFPALSATSYSNPLYAGEAYGGLTIELNVTAGITGTFSLQGTFEPCPELTTDADWFTVSTPVIVSGALAYAGAAAITVLGPTASIIVIPEWWRIKYTHTSGAATIRAFARVDDIH